MLHQRKMNDISKIIKNLKPYSSFEIFNHLSKFKNPNPNLNNLVLNDMSVHGSNRKSIIQKSLQLSTAPNLETSKSFVLNSNGKIMENDSQNLFSKKINVFDKIQGNHSLYNRSYTLVNFTKKSSLDKSLNNMTVDLNSYLELETILNFLEFNKVPFISGDVAMIFEEMGSTGSSLKLEELERYFDLEAWS